MQPKTPVAREEDSTFSQVPSSTAFVQQDLTLKLFQTIMQTLWHFEGIIVSLRTWKATTGLSC